MKDPAEREGIGDRLWVIGGGEGENWKSEIRKVENGEPLLVEDSWFPATGNWELGTEGWHGFAGDIWGLDLGLFTKGLGIP